MVEVVRRYSRQPHLWRKAKQLQKLLNAEVIIRPTIAPNQVVRQHKLGQRVAPEVVAQMVGDYENGLSSTQLQRKYKLSKGSVLKLLQAAGVEMRRRGLSDEQVAMLIERYRAGLTIREVAAEQRLAKTTVQVALAWAGVNMRPLARRRKILGE